MRRLWHNWLKLLAVQEGGESLALIRIGAGLCVIYAVLPVITNGLTPLLWMAPTDGGYQAPAANDWLISLLGGPSSTIINTALVTTLVAGGCLVLGIGRRLTPLIAGQGLILLTRTNPFAGGAYDSMLLNLLWLLFLSRSTATWSLDCRIIHKTWTRQGMVPAWPRYLILLQLLLIYGSTGIQKVSSHWVPVGDLSAVYYTLQQPSWQRWDMSWLAHVYPLTQIGTLITWLWEITAPLMLVVVYYRGRTPTKSKLRAVATCIDWRIPFAVVGFFMHTLVWILMDLGLFSLIAISMYPSLWTPKEIRTVLARPARNRHETKRHAG